MTKKEAAKKLYSINSWISGHFVTKLREPTHDDMVELNKMLGWVIEELSGE